MGWKPRRVATIDDALHDLELRAAIGDAAIAWRESLKHGRFHEIESLRTTLYMLIFDYLELLNANTDNPGNTGVHPDGSDADAAGGN